MAHETESELVGHEPCPECGSKDNLGRYDDGHGYCFGCEHYQHATDTTTGSSVPKVERQSAFLQGEITKLVKRKIPESTCRKFGYYVGRDSRGKAVQLANYKDEDGNEKCQKIRGANKQFMLVGDTKKPPLYGMHLWKRGGRKIIVTEGEIDCLSVSTVQDDKWPVVSLPIGATSAKKAITNNLEYLESFEEVILMFDDDEAGHKAVANCVGLLTPSKLKVTYIDGFKDANEALVAGRKDLIIAAIWNAKGIKIDGVFSAGDVLDGHMVDLEEGLSFPWPSVTEITHGQRPHEIYGYGAGTGVGKTDTFKEIIAHNIKVHNQKCGTIFMEEPNLNLTLTTVSGKIDSTIYHVNTSERDEEKYKATKESLRHMLMMYQVGGALDIETLMTTIRFMVVAEGCEHIFLDHITYILDGEEGDSQLSAMKLLMRGLNDLNKELSFTLHYISHLRKATNGRKPHEEGGRVYMDDFSGGKAATQYANIVFGMERDQQGDETNTSQLRCLKDRLTGQAVGKVIHLRYNPETGRNLEDNNNPFDNETTGSGEF